MDQLLSGLRRGEDVRDLTRSPDFPNLARKWAALKVRSAERKEARRKAGLP